MNNNLIDSSYLETKCAERKMKDKNFFFHSRGLYRFPLWQWKSSRIILISEPNFMHESVNEFSINFLKSPYFVTFGMGRSWNMWRNFGLWFFERWWNKNFRKKSHKIIWMFHIRWWLGHKLTNIIGRMCVKGQWNKGLLQSGGRRWCWKWYPRTSGIQLQSRVANWKFNVF